MRQAAGFGLFQKRAIGGFFGGDLPGGVFGQCFERLQLSQATVLAAGHIQLAEGSSFPLFLQVFQRGGVVLGELLADVFVVARERFEGIFGNAALQRVQVRQAQQRITALQVVV